ncbi:MAG: putative basic amino acid antiporter YfcC [Hungatella sp.]|nr:putative basic amino acid antiporter YfcC [Hungatella sp.]
MDNTKEGAAKKKFNFSELKVPHTYVIIFCIIIAAAILTHLIPSGTYDRYENANGTTVVDPMSFHEVEAPAAGIMDVLNAAPKGMKAAAGLIFFVFIIGGTFQIINGTGAIDLLIGKLIRSLKGKEQWIIPIFLCVFSLGGALMGMSNEVLAFVPIGIVVARKAGFDAAIGTAMVTLGAAAGFCGGTMNPFNVGIAQGIAELPIYSGLGYRLIIHVTFLAIASVYMMRYAAKVKADPTKSIVYNLEKEASLEDVGPDTETVSLRHYLVLGVFALGLAWIVWGVITHEWGTDEMQPIFIAIGIAGGLVGGLAPSQIAREFVNGAKALAFGALVIGIARGILIVLQNGMILDTIVYSFGNFLQKLPPAFAPLGMYLVHIILNVFIPSGSGQAAATMPLFVPLADVTGVTRQVAVLAFQLGDGITNSINPTSSNMNAYLGLSKIQYAQWVRFAGPILGTWIAAGGVFIVIGYFMNYGPF